MSFETYRENELADSSSGTEENQRGLRDSPSDSENIERVQRTMAPETSRMAGIEDIPKVGKIHQFTIKPLKSENSRYWLSAMKEQLAFQDCWDPIEKYERMTLDEYKELLQAKKGWLKLDMKARLMIKTGLTEETQLDCKDIAYAGELWDFLYKKYGQRSNADRARAIKAVTAWKKDQDMPVEESLEQFERLNSERVDITSSVIDKETLMFLFLEGLGDEFSTARDNIITSGLLERNEILSRLKDVERRRQPVANRAQHQNEKKCYACQGYGHIARDCANNKKKNRASEDEESGQERKSHRDPKGPRQSQKDKPKRKGKSQKARAAEKESQSSSEFEYASEDTNRAVERISIELAWRAQGTKDLWCIDSGATKHCTGNKGVFEILRNLKGTLKTAGGPTPIEGCGIARFRLPNGQLVRLGQVLYVPELKENLLSTELLHKMGIGHTRMTGEDYRFYQNKKLVATGQSDRSGSSYLDWVANQNAIFTGPDEQIMNEKAKVAAEDKEWKKRILHRRLGHPADKRFKKLLEDMHVDDVHIDKDEICEICAKGKMVKKQNHQPVKRASYPLKRVFMDFWGPYRDEPSMPEKYYLALVDDYSRYSWIFTMRDRRAEKVYEVLRKWIANVERQSERKVKKIHTDNAPEFKSAEAWLEELGIEVEFIEPYTPAQNGVAERLNRFLLEIARCLHIDSGIPERYWKYAVKTANYLRNRTAYVDIENGEKKTPFELWNGYGPDLNNLRTWGCRVLYHEKDSDKLQPRAKEGTFMAYAKSEKQYFILTPEGNERLVTNPIFFEEEKGLIPLAQQPKRNSQPTGGQVNSNGPTPSGSAADKPSEMISAQPISSQKQQNEQGKNENVQDKGEPTQPIQQDPTDKPVQPDPQPDQVEVPMDKPTNPPPQAEMEMDARPSRQRMPSKAMLESQATEQIYGCKRHRAEGEEIGDPKDQHPAQRPRLDAARLATAIELLLYDPEYEILKANRIQADKEGVPIPRSYGEAINDPIYGQKWREAIHTELQALIKYRTWKFIQKKEVLGKNLISTKWVFDVKIGIDGQIECFKARLVARGFTQKEGYDFDNTFAPVFRLESLRILFAIAAWYGLSAHLLDASNAFVGSQLDKPNYIEIPEGLEVYEPEVKDGSLVLELQQSLYGLKQSAYLWNQKLAGFIKQQGFKPITADPSVFINHQGIIMAIYVDDILIFGKSTSGIEAVKNHLKEFHEMKDYGLATKILGIRISWRSNGIRLDQEVYAKQILQEFGMENCKSASTPMGPSIQLDDVSSPRLNQNHHKLFQQIIGRLMFLNLGTRPDISFATNRLSQHLAEPQDVHLQAAKHLLRYVKGTIGYGISYSKGRTDKLVGYVDSAFANATGKRSTSAHIFMIGGSPVSWSSRKQSVVAHSTTEAEYMVLAEAAKQAIWIQHFLYGIHKPEVYISRHSSRPTTILYEDNQGAIALVNNPVNHTKTKHIQVRYHAIREAQENGDIFVEYLPTSQMAADALTKAASATILQQLIKKLQLKGSG